ncbi:site-specific DNA-methyltransferase [Patescibacteria group bacterium]|nr:site-specific DNA-methyltransferase [Patescibacteria group bacterium]
MGRPLKEKINDLDLKNWKEYGDLLTDSLWLINERDKTGAHNNQYHGNFVPQIPHQLMRRFTKKGDVVLDAFLGNGTTLIESKRLGRNGIGIELLPDVAESARKNINQGELLNNTNDAFTDIIVGDSTAAITKDKVIDVLHEHGRNSIHHIILHPPYHDIIKFSNKQEDLSNTGTVEDFARRFGDVIENFVDLLERYRYLSIVIGDKYTNSEWVPLGFYLMQETMKRAPNLRLKSILVKNMANNRAKINQEKLWRYRALVGGFYIFKHEYILIFQKI